MMIVPDNIGVPMLGPPKKPIPSSDGARVASAVNSQRPSSSALVVVTLSANQRSEPAQRGRGLRGRPGPSIVRV